MLLPVKYFNLTGYEVWEIDVGLHTSNAPIVQISNTIAKCGSLTVSHVTSR